MERIRSAIEKARVARHEGDSPQSANPAKPRVKSRELSGDGRRELWTEIPEFTPVERVLNRHRVLAYGSVKEATPFHVMRTKLLQTMRSNDWSRVAISSPGSGSGKTITALNLAFSLARQQDVYVMVVELDMRRPGVMTTLGIKEPCQFSRALEGEPNPEQHMRRYGPNLILAMNRTSARDPSELLQGVTAAHVIDALQKTYQPDIMLFDMPPVMAGDDTIAFLDQVDCALLLGEAERSTIEELDKCEREISARTNMLGVVLNKCRYLGRHEEYGKEYGY